MKYLIFFFLFSISILQTFSQNINDYQYVIIPEKYDFAKSIDAYQLNSLTQFLFNKYGFDSYRERDKMPFGLEVGSCNALYADVESKSSFLTAKFKVILKDCNGEIIFISEQGKSKDKDFKRAYHEALRNAFVSIEELKYKYNGASGSSNTTKKDEVVVNVENDTNTSVNQEEVKTISVNEEVSLNTKESSSIIGAYKSSDGFYDLIVEENNVAIFEGKTKIGTAILKDDTTYEVKTSQFEGIGRFENNTFIVDREIKGIGTVQMIFTKN